MNNPATTTPYTVDQNVRIGHVHLKVADLQRAQAVSDEQLRTDWAGLLDGWVRRVNPAYDTIFHQGGWPYYWSADQTEWATDVLFRTRQALADLYPRLLDHATLQFSAADILTFLGRRLHPRFDGEVLTTCKKDRLPGARIKHRVKNNWLKMYDKFGQVLRIETVINQPREFKVRRWRTRHGRRRLLWCPMNKGVANFYHYHAVARAANQRYLDALAVVDPPQVAEKHLDRTCKPVKFHSRRRRGLNLLRAEEQKLFRAVLRGEHRLNGFRNRDVAEQLFGSAARSPAERRRRTAQVSRHLQLLRAHGLIAKVAHSHRYRVTAKGEALMSAATYIRCKAFPKELDGVA